MGDEEIVAEKQAVRRQLERRRRSHSAARLAGLAERLAHVVLDLPEVQAADTVSAYVGVGAEPGTGPLVDALRERGTRVLLPITYPDMTLDWAEYTGAADLVPARYGLLEPAGPRLGTDAVADAQVVLLPAMAIAADGTRLGRGGGCYDRVLTIVPATAVTCALVYADEVIERVPAEPHDAKVHLAATPDGVTRFG